MALHEEGSASRTGPSAGLCPHPGQQPGPREDWQESDVRFNVEPATPEAAVAALDALRAELEAKGRQHELQRAIVDSQSASWNRLLT
jgi:hypothetical protein